MSTESVADVQSSLDNRNLPVNRVGIKGILHPIIFEDSTDTGAQRQHTVARLDMMVDLPKDVKGTHMSRFVQILNEQDTLLSTAFLAPWLKRMVVRLNATNGFFKADFPYFIKKTAPVSNTSSLLDYQVSLEGTWQNNTCQTRVTIVVPVTSLCPCSKEISEYGAHNQRSHVTATLIVKQGFSLAHTISLIESHASCELFGLLKRTDEKWVTERAFENPKFVEDLVRDIAAALDTQKTIAGYKISSENFESIHNHSAYAEIDKLETKGTSTCHEATNQVHALEID